MRFEPSLHYAFYVFRSGNRLPVTDTLPIAEALRSVFMGLEKKYSGPSLSSVFSGKNRAGSPLKGHQHAYIVPLDQDNDGFIDHLLIYAAMGFSCSVLFALDKIEEQDLFSGRVSLRLQQISATCPTTLEQQSTIWESVTPFVTMRHYRQQRDGPHQEWLLSEVTRFCRQCGRTAPSSLQRLPAWRGAYETMDWKHFKHQRASYPLVTAYGLRLVFEEPQTFPLMLGEFSHFGLGRFWPPTS